MDIEYAMDSNPIGRHADVFGPILQAIEARDGHVSPEAVVKYAKGLAETHPLRRMIWGESDAEAARKYRLSVASHIISHIKIILRTDDAAPMTVRMFFPGSERGTYSNISTIMSSDELRDQTLGQAAKDAEQYRNKYRFLKEVAPIIDAIERVMKKSKVKK